MSGNIIAGFPALPGLHPGQGRPDSHEGGPQGVRVDKTVFRILAFITGALTILAYTLKKDDVEAVKGMEEPEEKTQTSEE